MGPQQPTDTSKASGLGQPPVLYHAGVHRWGGSGRPSWQQAVVSDAEDVLLLLDAGAALL